MHMISKNDLTAEGADTIRALNTLCNFRTANGTVWTSEEATVYIKDLDMLVTVQLLEDSPAVLCLGRRCGELEYI